MIVLHFCFKNFACLYTLSAREPLSRDYCRLKTAIYHSEINLKRQGRPKPRDALPIEPIRSMKGGCLNEDSRMKHKENLTRCSG